MFFWIENLAAALGVLSVWLMARQKPIAWPIGFFMVVLYAIVFFEAKLYSETLLQIIYAGLQAYGWWCWLRGAKAQALPVTILAMPCVLRDLAIGAVITLALGSFMHLYTDAQMPWLDAALTGLSLVGQYWMAHKRLQCWPLWLVVDVAYVGMFWAAGLVTTTLLYVGFIGLAVYGWRQWSMAMAQNTVLPLPKAAP